MTEPEQKGLPRLDSAEIKKFVLDFMAGDVFTDFHVTDKNLLPMVFMPLAMGGYESFSEKARSEIGCVYARFSDGTFPRSINGYPIFGSCAFMHKDDWARAHAAITKARDALENIDV
jgi:hypothetical protein